MLGILFIAFSRIKSISWKITLWVLLPLGLICIFVSIISPYLSLISYKVRLLLESISDLVFYSFLVFSTLVVRLAWVLLVPTVPRADALLFHSLASNLAISGKYTINASPFAFYPTGYPAFLSIFYDLFGGDIFVAKLVNILLSVGIVFLIYKIANIVFGKNAAKLASLFYAFYPASIGFCSTIMSELFYTFLFLLFILLVLEKDFRKKWFSNILLGLVIGFLILSRGIFLFIPLVVFLYDLVKGKKIWKIVANTFIIWIIVILVILPWTVRNKIVFGEFILIDAHAGHNLYVGNNPQATGGYSIGFDPAHMTKHPLFVNLNTIKKDKIAFQYAVKYITNNPIQFLFLMPLKFMHLYSWDTAGIFWSTTFTKSPLPEILVKVLYVLNQIFYYLILFLFLSSVFGLMRKKALAYNPLFLLLLVLYITSIYLVFFGMPRYHFVLMPIFVIFAAYAFSEI